MPVKFNPINVAIHTIKTHYLDEDSESLDHRELLPAYRCLGRALGDHGPLMSSLDYREIDRWYEVAAAMLGANKTK
tara:strand:- start:438 stop:665 length:228 start_codon:yes stop_codon:yes gene_type:complete